MMLSALSLTATGVFVFLVSLMVTKFISSRDKEKKELEKNKEPTEPLLIFAEQFLEALIKNINDKPSSSQHSSQN
jgi:hypothetical protein